MVRAMVSYLYMVRARTVAIYVWLELARTELAIYIWL